MKLQPPKPPKAEVSDKNNDKKSTVENDFGNALPDDRALDEVLQNAGALDIPDSQSKATQTNKDETKIENKLDEPEIPTVEDMLPPDVATPPMTTIHELPAPQVPAEKEKKKGIFSRIFSKNKPASETEVIKKVEEDIEKFNDADANLDELNSALEKSIGEAEIMDRMAPIDEVVVPPITEKPAKDKKYVPAKSWDEDLDELPELMPASPSESFVNNNKPKEDSLKKETEKEYIKTDYSKYAPAPKSSFDNADKASDKSDLDLKLEEIQNKVSSISKNSKNNKDKSSSKKEVKGKEDKKGKQEKKTIEEKKDDEDFDFTSENAIDVKDAPEIQSVNEEENKPAGDGFTEQVDEWKNKAVAIAQSKPKLNKKEFVEMDVRIKKLLRVYENKLRKIADQEKKFVLMEKSILQKKTAEVERKKQTIQEKENKLVEIEKSLNERKEALDTLTNQEKTLRARKEGLVNDVEAYKKMSADLKAEVFKVQEELKEIRKHYSTEKSKGQRALMTINAQVNTTQEQLNSLVKKSRVVSSQLKAKEQALHERETEVMELIEQEKKILEILKGNENKGITKEDVKIRFKMKNKKPATIIGFDGQPEIYADDEDKLNKKINDCKDLIHESNFDVAKLLYNEIRNEFMNAVLEENTKRQIKHEIRELYDEISLKIISPK
jgi:hypothetical protein